MTVLLEQAVSKAAALSAEQQDALAALLLEEMADDARWDMAFAASQDVLAGLAADAMAEHAAETTRDLDPDAIAGE